MESNGVVKLHSEIPESFLTTESTVAFFGDDVAVEGLVYQDILTGITTNGRGGNNVDSISASAKLQNLIQQDSLAASKSLSITKLKESFPKAVLERKDGRVLVDYLVIVPVIVSAFNELQEEVDRLKAQLSVMKERIKE